MSNRFKNATRAGSRERSRERDARPPMNADMTAQVLDFVAPTPSSTRPLTEADLAHPETETAHETPAELERTPSEHKTETADETSAEPEKTPTEPEKTLTEHKTETTDETSAELEKTLTEHKTETADETSAELEKTPTEPEKTLTEHKTETTDETSAEPEKTPTEPEKTLIEHKTETTDETSAELEKTLNGQDEASTDQKDAESDSETPAGEEADPEDDDVPATDLRITTSHHLAAQALLKETTSMTVRALCCMQDKNCVTYKKAFRQMYAKPRGKGMSSSVFLKQTAYSYAEIQINLEYASVSHTVQVATISICSKHVKDLQIRQIDMPGGKPAAFLRHILFDEVQAEQAVRIRFETMHRAICIEMNEDFVRRKRLELGNASARAVAEIRQLKTTILGLTDDSYIPIDLFIPRGGARIDNFLWQLEHVVLAPTHGHPAKELFKNSPSAKLIELRDFAAKAGSSTAPDPVRIRAWDQADYTAMYGRAVVDEHLLQKQMADDTRNNIVTLMASPIAGMTRGGLPTQYLFLVKTRAVELLPRMDEQCQLELCDVDYAAPDLPSWPYPEEDIAKMIADHIVSTWRSEAAVSDVNSKNFRILLLMSLAKIRVAPERESRKDRAEALKAWLMEVMPVKDVDEHGRVTRELDSEWRERLTRWAIDKGEQVKRPEWAPNKDDRRPWKVTRVPIPDDLFAEANAAFVGTVPRHPQWPMGPHPDTGELIEPLPLVFDMPTVDLCNPRHLNDEARRVEGYFLPEESDLPMKACIEAINSISQQAAADDKGAAAFIKDFDRPAEFLSMPETFPAIGRLVRGEPGNKRESKIKDKYDRLNDDQKKPFHAANLPHRHLMIHGAPGSGKTGTALLLSMALLTTSVDPAGISTQPKDSQTIQPQTDSHADPQSETQPDAQTDPQTEQPQTDSRIDAQSVGHPDKQPDAWADSSEPENAKEQSFADYLRESLEDEFSADAKPTVVDKMVITCSENTQGDDLCERMDKEWKEIDDSELKIVRLSTMTREMSFAKNATREERPETYDEVDTMALKTLAREILEAARNLRAVKKDRRPHGGDYSLSAQITRRLSSDKKYLATWELMRGRSEDPTAFADNLAKVNKAIREAAFDVLSEAQVIVATPTALHTLKNHAPEICEGVKLWLQEEAGRMTEPEWLVAMAACPNVWLRITTGDPNQSPPLVFGAEAFTKGATKDGLVENAYCQKAQQLATSPMRRWMDAGMPITRLMLTTRQSGRQETFISRMWYRGDMKSLRDLEVESGSQRTPAEKAAHRMFRNPNIVGAAKATTNLVIWNIESKDVLREGTSWKNEIHSKAAMEATRQIQAHGLSRDGKHVPSVGIICPYQAQRDDAMRILKKTPGVEIVHDLVEARTTRAAMGADWDFAVVLMTRDDERSGFTSAKHNVVVSLSRGALGTVVIMSESATKGRSVGDKILAKFFKSAVDQGDIWTPDKKFFLNYCTVCCNSHKADKCKGVARKAPLTAALAPEEIRRRVSGKHRKNKAAGHKHEQDHTHEQDRTHPNTSTQPQPGQAYAWGGGIRAVAAERQTALKGTADGRRRAERQLATAAAEFMEAEELVDKEMQAEQEKFDQRVKKDRGKDDGEIDGVIQDLAPAGDDASDDDGESGQDDDDDDDPAGTFDDGEDRRQTSQLSRQPSRPDPRQILQLSRQPEDDDARQPCHSDRRQALQPSHQSHQPCSYDPREMLLSGLPEDDDSHQPHHSEQRQMFQPSPGEWNGDVGRSDGWNEASGGTGQWDGTGGDTDNQEHSLW